MRLEEILQPIPPAQFFREHWQRRPLLVRGMRGRFSGLFSSKDVGRLIHFLAPLPPEGIKLIKGGDHYGLDWTDTQGRPRLSAVREAWRAGYTVVVNAMDTRWEPLALLAASLHEELHHPVDINLYYSPPQVVSSSAHFDVMDSFILQVEGSKVWEVREPAGALPLADEQAGIPQDALPPLVLETELREGDVLYLPRGHVHVTKTTEAASLHLTVGINVVTWVDLFAAAVSAARDDERLRAALPPSFLDAPAEMRATFQELRAELTGRLDMEAALGRLAERLLVGAVPPPGDERPAQEVELRAETPLARRAGVVCHTLAGAGYAAIQYTGGKIVGPEKLAAAFRYVAQHRTLTAADLPGQLSTQEQLVLARRLVRGGLLEVRGPGES